MNRKQPENPNNGTPWPPEVGKQADQPKRIINLGGEETTIIVQTRQYKLITPLFGGGVKPGVNDTENLIRATEIRGQLRFWWRAIRGGRPEFQGSLKKMRDRENEIWGAASNTKKQTAQDENGAKADEKPRWREPVQIEVEIQDCGQPVKPFKPEPKDKGGYKAVPVNGIPDYAAFPLRPKEEDLQRMGMDTPIEDLRKDVEFSVKVTYPAQWEDDILAALWAWETFGGVGARTRRGFGCLQRTDDEQKDLPLADASEAEAWIEGKLKRWCPEGKFPANVPHLGANMRISLGWRPAKPLVAWKSAIDKLKKFRQIPDGRDKRSKWPEAETIREVTGYRYHKLRSLGHPQKYPRAIFGLPIVFHFKDENTKAPLDRDYDPPEMTLQGASEGQERWASPLILRPLLCQNGQALSLACVLPGSNLPEQMSLVARNEIIPSIKVEETQTHLKARETTTLPVLQNQTNILLAFLKYFKA